MFKFVENQIFFFKQNAFDVTFCEIRHDGSVLSVLSLYRSIDITLLLIFVFMTGESEDKTL